MSDFKRAWQATCPRCSKIISSESFVCDNCRKGAIKAVTYTIHGVCSLYLGCEYCGNSFGRLPKCKCGAQITKEFVRVSGVEGCFVATAVFQDNEHPIVKELRQFRDSILVKHKTGRAFISWYYENGPHMASVVSKNPVLRPLTKTALTLFGVALRIGKKVFG